MIPIIRNSFTKPVSELLKRKFRTSAALHEFWEKDPKGGYKDTRPPLSFKERMRLGLSELKNEIALWKEEVKDAIDFDPPRVFRRGEVDVLWQFTDQSSLDKWVVTADADHGEGKSSCSLSLSQYGHGLFTGNLVTKAPMDGKVKRAGYCNIKTLPARKSFKRETYLDWSDYNMLVMKVRGDGRPYLLNIHSKGYFDITWNDTYHYILYTRGGPYWQVSKIPFSKFFLSSKGRIQDRQVELALHKVTSFGITAGDRYGGNFQLEIDYIGLECDYNHTEQFAYELYKIPRNMI